LIHDEGVPSCDGFVDLPLPGSSGGNDRQEAVEQRRAAVAAVAIEARPSADESRPRPAGTRPRPAATRPPALAEAPAAEARPSADETRPGPPEAAPAEVPEWRREVAERLETYRSRRQRQRTAINQSVLEFRVPSRIDLSEDLLETPPEAQHEEGRNAETRAESVSEVDPAARDAEHDPPVKEIGFDDALAECSSEHQDAALEITETAAEPAWVELEDPVAASAAEVQAETLDPPMPVLEHMDSEAVPAVAAFENIETPVDTVEAPVHYAAVEEFAETHSPQAAEAPEPVAAGLTPPAPKEGDVFDPAGRDVAHHELHPDGEEASAYAALSGLAGTDGTLFPTGIEATEVHEEVSRWRSSLRTASRPRSSERMEISVPQPLFDSSSSVDSTDRPLDERLPVADLRERRISGLMDAVILAVTCAGFFAAFHMAGGEFLASRVGAAVGLAAVFLIYALYFLLFTSLAGATPGMLLRGLQVVCFDGSRPEAVELGWRGFGYLLSAAPGMLGFLWAAWDDDGLTWHDRISQTYITYADPGGQALSTVSTES
jgi:uncharacterized RDD family membrane protein YckC